MAHRIVHPADGDEAVAMLSRATRTLDTPNQYRLFDADRQREAYDSGRRRPAWTWQALDEDGTQRGLVAGQGAGDVCWVLDLIDLPPDDPDAAVALLRAAADELRGQPEPVEVALSCPVSDDPRDHPEVVRLDSAIRDAGFHHLADRLRYEVTVDQHPLRLPTTLTLQKVAPDDPWLLELMRRIVMGSLDAHQRHQLRTMSDADVARAELEFMVSAEGPDSLHLALDSDGHVVGLVQFAVWPDGRGCLAFVGVPEDQRGRGTAGRLTSLATQALLKQGCETVIGDTDVGNVPMRRAFESVGFRVTESRVDYVWPTP
ncbi:GNAT family N-acetyltransferase [Nigerium massiliense]|uniref:GNAT family N-acetyltransferase n=1 Tax=Nigerium massiliense TaxID=1522317 RepID=UPI0006937C55|nr:GNAT family N-acetyltransferase [Nigerium massiliense]